jgi:hypothetical protein
MISAFEALTLSMMLLKTEFLFFFSLPSDPPLLFRSDDIAIDPPKLFFLGLENREDLSEVYVRLITEPAPDLRDLEFVF